MEAHHKSTPNYIVTDDLHIHCKPVPLTRAPADCLEFSEKDYPRLASLTKLWSSGTSCPTILSVIQAAAVQCETDLSFGLVDLKTASAISDERKPFELPIHRRFDNGSPQPDRRLVDRGGPAEWWFEPGHEFENGAIAHGFVSIFKPPHVRGNTQVRGIINTKVNLLDALRLHPDGTPRHKTAKAHKALSGTATILRPHERTFVAENLSDIIGVIFMDASQNPHPIFLRGVPDDELKP